MEFVFGAAVGAVGAWVATRWAVIKGWYLAEEAKAAALKEEVEEKFHMF